MLNKVSIMGNMNTKDKSLIYNISFRTGVILTLISIAVYLALAVLLMKNLQYDIILLLIIPAVVSSALLGLKIGLVTTIALPLITVGIYISLGEGDNGFLPKFIAGTIINLVAAFTIGRLRDMHQKLLQETDKRIEIEHAKEKQSKSFKQLEARLRSIFENASIGFYRISTEGSIVMVNPALLKMMKYPFSEIVFQQDMSGEFYPHYGMKDFKKKMEKHGKIIGAESEWTRYDGTTIYIHETAWSVKDEFGETQFYDGIISDITEMKQTEKALQENMELLNQEIEERKKTEKILKDSEEKYRDLVEKAGIAIVMDDKDGKIRYYNKPYVDLFGYTESEIKKMTIHSFIHPDDAEKVKEFHNERIEGHDSPSRYQFKCLKKDGSECFIEVDAVILKENDEITGTRSYMWDVTDRNKALTVAHENEERFRGILHNSNVGFYRTTPKGEILMANQALLKMLKYPNFDILAKNKLEDDPAPEYARLQFKKHIERDGVIFGYEDEWKAYDGTTIYIRESAWLIKDKKGKPLYYEGFVENMSDLIELNAKVESLSQTLTKYKTDLKLVSGIWPICSSCGKIKDGEKWLSIQDYINNNPDKEIGMRICQDCAKNLSEAMSRED